jgi:hypothetical protein
MEGDGTVSESYGSRVTVTSREADTVHNKECLQSADDIIAVRISVYRHVEKCTHVQHRLTYTLQNRWMSQSDREKWLNWVAPRTIPFNVHKFYILHRGYPYVSHNTVNCDYFS